MGGKGIKGSKSYSSKRGTTSWSSASSSHPVPRSCKCREQLLLLTSNSCNFFHWADKELSQEAA
ncbi:PaaX family transcriptional regulator [Sesbania bispinosa]|nr:PaaX family transcriptional regulator [Sesbania bispinosa]